METAKRPPSAGSLRTLLPYAARYKWRIVLALVALLVANAATLAMPIAFRLVIDAGFGPNAGGVIDRHFVSMLVVATVLAVATSSRYYLVVTLSERIAADLRAAVFERLTTLSPQFFDSARVGELTSRLTADTTQIKSAFGASASIAIRNLLLFVGAAIMMVVTSVKLSLLVLMSIPVIVLPLVAMGRRVQKRARLAQDTVADASAYASEVLAGMRTVQAFNAEELANHRFEAASEKAYLEAESTTRSRALLVVIVIFLVFASLVVVLWVGAKNVVSGTISTGTLGQFIFYGAAAAAALAEVTQVSSELRQMEGAGERLGELLAEEPRIKAPASPARLPEPPLGTVSFDRISFAYPTQPRQSVITDFSLDVKRGETVALVGLSGAGKSTLFHLLLRYYDPTAGRVLLDGVALPELDPHAARARIAIVPQEAMIFAASARENIRFGRPDASDEEVERAADLASAGTFVRALPDGFETLLGERGVTLSGGQRQRIAIARAILKDAPILLLDEATSSLDSESERAVQAALERLMNGRTTLVIAHRLSTVLAADRIVVLDSGRVEEVGKHHELVARGGLYAKLATLQFQDGAPRSLRSDRRFDDAEGVS